MCTWKLTYVEASRLAVFLLLAGGACWSSNAVVVGQTPEGQSAEATAAAHESLLFFENSVRPLLIERCMQCHGPDKQEGGLRLDSADALAAGGDSGPAIEGEAFEESLLLAAVRYDGLEMPPSGQLPAEEVAVFEQWVARGAPWPEVADGGMSLRSRGEISSEDRDYWAFRPLQQVEPPAVDGLEQSAATPVDQFLLSRLQSEGLQFAPPADRRTLVRRAYLDLVGVPPTAAELAEYLTDDRPDAYEQLLHRLQDDKRYGEKWARFWLDLVRYAESDGFNQDAERPTAYLYRDWLIDALNADVPYDQFVLQQLAGDELDATDPKLLAATGFLRHWIYEYNQRDARTQLSNILNDLTDVTGEVFFGLGVGCARCHDHKFDPLLQEDYYRLQAAFADFLPDDDRVFGTDEQVASYYRQLAAWEEATQAIRDRMRELEEPVRKRVSDAAYNKFPLDVRPMLFKPAEERDGFEQQITDLADRQVKLEWKKIDYTKSLKGEAKEEWEALDAELKTFEHLRPADLPRILAAGRVDAPTPSTIVPGRTTEDGPLAVRFVSFEVLGREPLIVPAIALPSAEVVEVDEQTAENHAVARRRTALATWINSRDNALTQRVIVNRIWQELFGTGLVQNANDFGRLGQPPTHPELLDWLAAWFIEDGKSFKRLQFLLMTSQAYRQSSQAASADVAKIASEVDWENRLMWRFPARRLQAEQIRDAMLVACGCLEAMDGGPSKPHDSRVRSVYTQLKRNRPHPFLSAFDVPDRSVSIGSRIATTTVNQSLVLSNSPWTIALAGEMAKQLQQEASDPELHIEAAFERTLGRLPNEDERAAMVDYLRSTTNRLLSERARGTLESTELAESTEQPVSTAVPEPAELPDSAEPDSAEATQPLAWYQAEPYRAALADMCHVLLNSSEFLYID